MLIRVFLFDVADFDFARVWRVAAHAEAPDVQGPIPDSVTSTSKACSGPTTVAQGAEPMGYPCDGAAN